MPPISLFKKSVPYLLVAAGAALWGGIGIFVNALDKAGFSSLEIVALRVSSASLMLYLYLQIRNPGLLRIEWRHLYLFIGTGVLSICFFNWSYFTAIRETSLSVAVILLYTGPAFVVLMSRFFFGERLTPLKIAALLFTFMGATLVVELFPAGAGSISRYGILVGIGSGLGYALYSIFSKFALRTYPPLTIIFYTFLTASAFMVPFSGIVTGESFALIQSSHVLLVTAGLGFFPTTLAYLLYTEGLSRIEAGKASITAMMEPVAATLIGVTLFGEVLSYWQVAGILLVVSSVVLIQLRRRNGTRVPEV